MKLPLCAYGLVGNHDALPLSRRRVEDVPELAALGVTAELYAHIFVEELGRVRGLGNPSYGPTESRRRAAFEADLREWQANATEKLRAVVPGAVVKTQTRVKAERRETHAASGPGNNRRVYYEPVVQDRFIVVALTPEEGVRLRDEPHITGDADSIPCPQECVCVFCACGMEPDRSCQLETVCCCKFTLWPGVPEGMDYYEWKQDPRCAVTI